MASLYVYILVFLQYGLMGCMLFFNRGVLIGISLWIFFLSVTVGLWAISHNKIGNFHIRPEFKQGATLVTSGIYHYIRHPMYLSVTLMMLAILIQTPTLLESGMFGLLLLTLFLKAKREESLWIVEDPSYAAYQKKSKLFLPFLI